jgi:5'-deoxynucleotidase YfbR-like HD superfamily hydrolase
MDKRLETGSHRNDNLNRIHKRLLGGHVVRYHTRPELADGQNVAAHTWRAMVILQTLWPEVSKNCLIHMLYHDVAEAETGDMPATTKWKYEDLALLMNKVEREYEQSIGVGLADWEITETEKALCNIADKLELVLHCTRMMQQGNMLAKDVFMKGVNYLEERYSKLEEFKPVKEIIAELDRYGLMREE